MKNLLLLLSPAALLAVTASLLPGQVIFNDTFDSGTPTGLGYYITNTSTGATSAVSGGSLVIEGANTNSLNFGTAVVKSFSTFDLGNASVGQYIQLAFSVTMTAVPNQNNGFRFGLFENPNAALTGNITGGNPPALRETAGYVARIGTGTSTVSSIGSYTATSLQGPSGSNEGTFATVSGPTFGLAAASTTFFWLELEKDSATPGQEYQIRVLQGATADRSLASSLVDNNLGSLAASTFDTVAFNLVADNTDVTFGQIGLSVVPEPSTGLLLIGGLTALVLLRRRRPC